MKSISFFPFTWMAEEQLQTMDLFFNRFKVVTLAPDTLWDPLFSSAVEMGRIDPVSLEDEPLAALETKLRSFRDWAAVHRGNEKNLKNLIRGSAYFQDETDVTAIQAGIRQGAGPLSGNQTEVETFTDPLLFLRFAEILDRENEEIRNKLSGLEQNNSCLFAELTGEIHPPEPMDGPGLRPDLRPDLRSGPRHDPGADRTGERIASWWVAARASGLVEPGKKCLVLATTSPAVLDYLAADTDPKINGLDIDSIKVHEHGCDRRALWQQNFYQTIDEFISGKTPIWTEGLDEADCGCRTGGIRLIRFPGGVLNERFKIPGTQVVVCLVKLNS